MRKLTLLLALAPAAAQAASFDRPIPQAQSATTEFWFALAALALIAALAVVARVVARR
ncbi:protein NnrT [Thioclava sediminum]|uniref:Protein NnrT n=1 Tax=Thioclava sediminum TaxID=1915319 RepID=A0ABX3MYF5_9RHOB|nr:protein NnrT [Thioclava sediminum]OOY24747.1 protein NnrT [Thioclava sediminum]